jgi:hypothetical protein|tara:strand:+ start:789 stop:920 length:132 start_codon:yes stop_codon:yes gene_type:complete
MKNSSIRRDVAKISVLLNLNLFKEINKNKKNKEIVGNTMRVLK